MYKFNQSTYTVTEGISHVNITVIRVNGDDESHALKWKTTDITAINGSDYVGGEHLVSMKKNESEKVIEIEIVNDAVAAEPDEKFRVELIADPNRAFILDTSKEATVTITDNDANSGQNKLYSTDKWEIIMFTIVLWLQY